ncbi:MAG: LiaF transmembrane domain-containing protein [Ignavibacteriales bacterium]
MKKVFGFMVIITGILLLFDNLNIVSFDNLFGLVISIGAIIVGITGLIEKKRFDFIMTMFIVFGGLYFLSNVGILEEGVVDDIFWPIVIIGIGLSLLFSVTTRVSNKSITPYLAIFSGVEEKNESTEYISSDITAIFGGAEVNYRKIKIKDNVGYINVTAIFGAATIMVPEDVKITVKGLPIFGGAENKAVSLDKARKELVINYTAIFGGVEIKN